MFSVIRRSAAVVGRVLFAALFLLGGLMHWLKPGVYLRIMPPYLPEPLALIYLSGVAEFVLGGLLLIPRTRRLAAWGLIALLIAVFPANLYMWRHAAEFTIPAWALLARLPLQGLLIAWAWVYTRPDRPAVESRSVSPARAVVACLGLATLTGCEVGRPSLPQLDKGAYVRTASLDGKPVVVYFAASEETVADGTVVRVVSDQEGTTQEPDRKVIVGFQDGPHSGLAALIRRSDLQPTR